MRIQHWLYSDRTVFEDAAKTLEQTIMNAIVIGASLVGARLVGARLVGARLDGASLDGARLDGASLDGASLDGARLDGASLDGASLDGASLDGASLVGARLDGASLDGASLDGASLVGARLDGASLDGARLVGASLDGASLDGASLDGASLDGASLDGASLVGASLVGASLDGASLVGARLVGARLRDADLSRIKADFFAVISAAPNEVAFLLRSIKDGEIDGTAYDDGDCRCLKGTIAKAKGCNYRNMPGILAPDASSPSERWFLGIRTGDRPDDNQIAAITVEWIEEWQKAREESAAKSELAEPPKGAEGQAASPAAVEEITDRGGAIPEPIATPPDPNPTLTSGDSNS